MPKSKIGCLPSAIQDELNERLQNNDDDSETLAWLNALPPVPAKLAERFRAQPINYWNLNLWRKTGFPAWINRHERFERLRQLERFAIQYAQTNHTALADGVVALAHARLLELLELVDDDAVAETPDPETDGGDEGQALAGTTAAGRKPVANERKRKLAVDQLAKIATTLHGLRAVEQGRERLKQNEKRIKQTDEKLSQQRDARQHESVDFYLQLLHDARAKEIEAEPAVSYEQRIEIMGQHIFGDLWKPRNIPGVVSLSPEEVAALAGTDGPSAPGENGNGEKQGGRDKIRRPKAGRQNRGWKKGEKRKHPTSNIQRPISKDHDKTESKIRRT